jgi:uncharacterized phiE125 gp8 family phage protein
MLITLAEAKEYLKVQHSLEDDLITELIEQASDRLAEKRGILVAKDFIDEEYNGGGDEFVILYHYPVNSITSVTVDGNEVEYEVDKRLGFLYAEGSFPRGPGRLKITYNAGFSVDNVPPRYKRACMKLVSDYYEGRGGELDDE